MLTGLQNSFTPSDLLLISAIALVCAGIMSHYGQIVAAVVLAVVADFTLPGIYALLTGAPVGEAMAASWTRLSGYSGATLMLRALVYFSAISILFGTRAAYGRR